MKQVIKPPNRGWCKVGGSDRDFDFVIFLAGSIEMGKAVDWQTELIARIPDESNIIILNPRRDSWDSSWVQSIDNAQFREQVEWELNAQECAHLIVYYFAPGTMSPISLLELGLNAHSGRQVVYCPEGFWRKGNVDVTCRRYYAIPQVSSWDALFNYIMGEYNVATNP